MSGLQWTQGRKILLILLYGRCDKVNDHAFVDVLHVTILSVDMHFRLKRCKYYLTQKNRVHNYDIIIVET